MWHAGKFLQMFTSLEGTRKRLLDKAPEGPLRDFLSVPFPSPDTLFEDIPILSVDFETTGLNFQYDQLLSVGFVHMQNKQIRLSDSYHQVVKVDLALNNDNVIIHQITDDIKDQGQPLESVVEALLKALAGKAMLVHYQAIETHFLAQACQTLYGMAPIYPIIDTFALAKKQMVQRNQPIGPNALRLSTLRANYNLPEHFGHNALNDAIATAELLLAQVAHRGDEGEVTLGDLVG